MQQVSLKGGRMWYANEEISKQQTRPMIAVFKRKAKDSSPNYTDEDSIGTSM
jgi:hypothetical protein